MKLSSYAKRMIKKKENNFRPLSTLSDISEVYKIQAPIQILMWVLARIQCTTVSIGFDRNTKKK